MIERVRSADQPLELEVRIGQFSNGNTFLTGYRHNERDLIKRLKERLEKNVSHLPNWTQPGMQSIFIRAEYENGIRQDCIPGSNQSKFNSKKCIEKLDLISDRAYDIRISLSEEFSIDTSQDTELCVSLKTKKPTSVRYIYRATYIEKVPIDEDGFFSLQYDISKVSQPSADKMDCTKAPCNYHCEIELLPGFKRLEDKREEMLQNEFIAKSLLARAKALLGTHIKLDNNNYKVLPCPRLKLLTN